MPELLTALATGTTLGLSAGLAPGPLTALLLGEALRHGRTAGLRIAVVPLLSDPPVVLLAVLTLRHLAQAERLLGLLSLVGAGVVTLLARDSFRATTPSATAAPAPVTLLRGLGTNWTNPHPYLFWATVGAPLLLRPESALAATAFLLSFYTCLVGAKAAMALVVAHFRRALLGAWYAWLNRALGALLLLLAGLLLRDGLRLLQVW